MIRRVFVLVMCSFVLSCASHAGDTEDFTKKIDTGLKEHFAVTGQCTSFWETEIDKWKGVNGKDFHSVESVRKSIVEDDSSLFSQLVREVWNYQEKTGNAKTRQRIGRWPVSGDEYRKATPLAFIANFDSIPSDCMSTIWLESSILNIFDNTEKKIVEVGGIELAEPYDKKWAIYWILVNINN